jgi:hypothetical protein
MTRVNSIQISRSAPHRQEPRGSARRESRIRCRPNRRWLGAVSQGSLPPAAGEINTRGSRLVRTTPRRPHRDWSGPRGIVTRGEFGRGELRKAEMMVSTIATSTLARRERASAMSDRIESQGAGESRGKDGGRCLGQRPVKRSSTDLVGSTPISTQQFKKPAQPLPEMAAGHCVTAVSVPQLVLLLHKGYVKVKFEPAQCSAHPDG